MHQWMCFDNPPDTSAAHLSDTSSEARQKDIRSVMRIGGASVPQLMQEVKDVPVGAKHQRGADGDGAQRHGHPSVEAPDLKHTGRRSLKGTAHPNTPAGRSLKGTAHPNTPASRSLKGTAHPNTPASRSLKGTAHPKTMITPLASTQARSSSEHWWNTSALLNTIKAQKHSKDIVTIIQWLNRSYENTFCAPRKQK